MTKLTSQQKQKNANNNNNNGVMKVKRTRRSVPRDSPPRRSSIYRGVTRHRWTGRYEAHLWDKNCWNESQNKKGRQVYLGAYDDEEAAAHSYDLAALKYWGHDTILNFPLSTYERELKEMEGQSREEYIGSLRRKSSGFSRGVSKYRGVARHHHNGRWEARIGRVFGNKYLYLGTYATQEEAATAYDMAAIEYRGLNAVTNFDLSRYIKWLKPNHHLHQSTTSSSAFPNLVDATSSSPALGNTNHHQELNINFSIDDTSNYDNQSGGVIVISDDHDQLPISTLSTDHHHHHHHHHHHQLSAARSASATSALGLLLQSSKFKEMMEMTSSSSSDADHQQHGSSLSTESEADPSQLCSFPEDVQTYFGATCQASSSYGDHGDDDGDTFFRQLNSFVPHIFQCELI